MEAMPRIVQARKDDRPAKEARISPVEARGASHPGTREARLLFQVCFFFCPQSSKSGVFLGKKLLACEFEE